MHDAELIMVNNIGVTGTVYIARCWQPHFLTTGYSLCHSGGSSGPVLFSMSGALYVLVDGGIAVSMCYRLYKMSGGRVGYGMLSASFTGA
ncbi:hypothetical protein NEOLEDRAFT_1139997 [Neolentinus lepideus HHB14362 ss-1]|uniref:Uncharacterized protein n=1 Tax=Neolentinus lepideus HHB14362 ss-1 TaxID=1314782 RepID=A0A165PFF4_9AGAM|nr:hypothetical protein NEOLEDRAFT_1139997 [Neolentinus lepideus HHB14362 ss-1]